MIIGNKVFEDKGKTYIMGILNMTPDSFSDGGKYNNIDAALKYVEVMVNDGADIIDIGGESTRPGADPVGEDEELERIIPVIEKVKNHYDIPVSVDTYHCAVAREVINAGADMINDVWGLQYDNNQPGSIDEMADVVSRNNVAVCITHNSRQMLEIDLEHANNRDLIISREINNMIEQLRESVRIALSAGIKKDKIMVDPGVGFAKDYNMNMASIANLVQLKKIGFPILLGASGKSVIGKTLDVPVEERLEGTLTTTVMAVLSGCSYVRVHDVKSNKRAILMAEELLNYRI